MAFNEENFGGDFDQLLRQQSLQEYHNHLNNHYPLSWLISFLHIGDIQ